MNRLKISRVVVAVSLVAGGIALGADEKPATPAQPATTTPAAGARNFDSVMQDVLKDGQALQSALPSPAALSDEAKRNEAAPKAIPALKRIVADLKELKATGDPRAAQIAQGESQLTSMLAMLGDKDAQSQLEKDAKDADSAKAIDAQSSLLLVRWVKASKDAAVQQELLDDAQKLATAHPDSMPVTMSLLGMGELGAATPALAKQAKQAAVAMNTPVAKQMKEQVDAEQKLASMENKRLTIEGVKLDGSKFSTADWKGKVIFVDFWATWCGPCKAELPRVKKAYADYHAKGLEVLGVSCDNEGAALQKFLDENKDMPWPQLFDVHHPGWHPLATSYGINGIPTMFLIDKKGVLRSVTARQNFEEMIPQLLAEKD
jgi:thiol-disulfide isomerase/thioredoxin